MSLRLAELEAPCPSCGRQVGVHTGGARRGGWAIYEPTWANATGWCQTPGCACTARCKGVRPGPFCPLHRIRMTGGPDWFACPKGHGVQASDIAADTDEGEEVR